MQHNLSLFCFWKKAQANKQSFFLIFLLGFKDKKQTFILFAIPLESVSKLSKNRLSSSLEATSTAPMLFGPKNSPNLSNSDEGSIHQSFLYTLKIACTFWVAA